MSVSSEILDRIPEVLERVLDDIAGGRQTTRGRTGMTAELVLRALVIKQMNKFSYEELAFELAANLCYRAFCRLGDFERAPKASTLQSNLKRLSPETLEAINSAIVAQAKDRKIEDGRKIRTDCTTTETNIHPPTDSTLLWDVVRVLTRLMTHAKEVAAVSFTDHTRRAKRRMVAIMNAGAKKKMVPLYRDLIKVTKKVIADAERVADELAETKMADIKSAIQADSLVVELRHFVVLGQQVVDQSRRRVLDGESVPVADKLVSIFESHTDILVKGRREVEYGHKICLTTGKSSLILDCVITSGNPADSTLAVEMIERHIERSGMPPRQAVFDGGFASKDNVEKIKKLGVDDVAFSKRCGLAITDMVKMKGVKSADAMGNMGREKRRKP